MTEVHGRFCWYELMTSDSAAAKTFYGEVVGWSPQEGPVPGSAYTLFTTAAGPVGGVMDLPEECRRMGMPPSWGGYVAVDDVDQSAALAEQLGGTIRVPATDIPQVGRFSVISDPQGATLSLFKALPGSGQPAGMEAPGSVGWHELQAADWQAVFAFYHQMFGWEKTDAMDMGEMGIYQLFAAGGSPIGGMFNKPPAVPTPFWLFYFNVGDIDVATQRAVEGGAQIVTGPTAVPGGGWIVQAKDPQGAMFALHGRRGADQGTADREFVIGRTFDAPRERVFDAWTDAGRLTRWWGPKGFTNPICETDPRPGGSYRIVMHSPEGVDYPIKGVYREVVRPLRLMMTDDCSEHPEDWLDQVNPGRPKGEGLEALSTVTFADEGGRTKLTIRTLFSSPEIRDRMVKMGMEQGWSESLDRLGDLLAAG